jgi:hypothetical protein
MDDPGNDLYGERDPLDRLLSLLGPKLDELRALLEEAPELALLRARPDHP